jgi:TonB family protein
MRLRLTIGLISLCLMSASPSAQNLYNTLDAETFKTYLTQILEQVNQPGAYQGKIALQFADAYNSTIREYPGSETQIDSIARSVAGVYELDFVKDGTIITTARFLKPIKSDKPMDVHPVAADSIKKDEPKEIFKVVEQMPRFPGCEDLEGSNDEKFQCAQVKLLEYIYTNLQYPAEARQSLIEGRCVVQFVVMKDGSLTDINCVRGLDYGTNEEAVRVVQLMNEMDERWTPGKQRGKPVEVQFTLPVSFNLQ